MGRAERRRAEREARKKGGSPIPLERTIPEDSIVQEEVKRLGIRYSAKEFGLWSQFGYQPLSGIGQLDEAGQHEAIRRMELLVNVLMPSSENHYFTNAISYVKDLHMIGALDVSLHAEDVAVPVGKKHAFMHTTAFVDGERVRYRIATSAKSILGEGALSVAIAYTHEVSHLRRIVAHVNTQLPLRPAQEIIQNPMIQTDEEYFTEEARATADATEAYIVEYGLAFRNYEGTREAALLLSCNHDPSHPKWINYVRRKLLTS